MDMITVTSWCPVHSEMLALRLPWTIRIRPSNLRYFLKVTLLSVLSVSRTMSAPSSTSSNDPPRWINPCGIPGHVFDPQKDMHGAPSIEIKNLYQNLIDAANTARENGVIIKKLFLNQELPGADLEDTGDVYGTEWLPPIPKATEENFRNTNQSEAFRKSFEYMQYFAVGIEQILLDQTLHEGKYMEQFQQVEQDLTQVLCQLQMGMFVLKIQANADVLRDVMSHQYRDIASRSARNLRDYLILRDYIKTTTYISQLFGYMSHKLTH